MGRSAGAMRRIPPVAVILAVAILALLFIPAVAQHWPELTGAVRTDIAYGPDRSQVLDICAPPNRSKTAIPALVMIHGGAWRSGGRKDWQEVCRRAAANGIVGIAIDYRLADGTTGHSWPAQLVDSQLAMRWVRTHADDYGIDPNRVCAIGDSAGGHLAVFLAALDHIAAGDYADRLPAVSPQANCVIDWFGPVDFSGFLARSSMMRAMFVGVKPPDYAEAERGASPLLQIGPHTAPILIVHGTEDRLINIGQSRALQDALIRNDIPNQLRIFRGGHEFADAEDRRTAFVDDALAFIKDPRGFLQASQPTPAR
jgi:acetyl esterase/lipase